VRSTITAEAIVHSRAAVVPNRRKKSFHIEIKRHVAAGSAVYTDALMSYQDLKQTYAHQVIDHAERYVVWVNYTFGGNEGP
jgi:hypothetical protein